jgi:hypothetical protein
MFTAKAAATGPGALTAAYRISRDGWTAAQAYEEMKKYDFDDGLFGGPSARKK